MASEPFASEPRPKLVYITSRGHSGSTLTEMLIGAHSRVTCLGELKQLGTHRQESCRCGAESLSACPFWSGVDEILSARYGLGLEKLELASPDPETFGLHNRALIDAAREVSGSEYLIDSSKTVERLRRLQESGLFEIRVIHLVRSPFGVVYSNVKRGRGLREHCINYTVAMMKTRELLQDQPVLELRYEDMVAAPERVLGGLMDALGLKFESEQLDWANQDTHTFAGNRMRMNRDSTIRPDVAWRQGLSRRQILQVAWWTLPARLGSSRLYEAHKPYWKGEGAAAWREHQWNRLGRRLRRLPRLLRGQVGQGRGRDETP